MSGYNHKLLTLLDAILDKLVHFEVSALSGGTVHVQVQCKHIAGEMSGKQFVLVLLGAISDSSCT